MISARWRAARAARSREAESPPCRRTSAATSQPAAATAGAPIIPVAQRSCESQRSVADARGSDGGAWIDARRSSPPDLAGVGAAAGAALAGGAPALPGASVTVIVSASLRATS